MADVIVLANNVTLTGSSAAKAPQPLYSNPMDVSAYDLLDLQVFLQAVNNVAGVKISIITSMSSNKEDDGSWNLTGIGSTVALTTAPQWVSLSVPTAGTTMFRYVRYCVDFQGATTSVTFSIQGMGRRRVT